MHRSSEHIHTIRRFNRFYTRKIGLLDETMLSTKFKLTEARILYEIGFKGTTEMKQLIQELGLDGGYLSRTVSKLREQGLISKKASEEDGRRYELSLTKKGNKTFEQLDQISMNEIGSMIGRLSQGEQVQLVQAMKSVQSLLSTEKTPPVAYILRDHEPGDLGWIVHRHGVFYTQAFGWNDNLEALCADIIANYVKHHDPARERVWIAERDGERIGSVMLTKESESVGRLRLLLVEPSARGLGIGKRLVQECTRFAKKSRYEKIVLDTVHILEAAHGIYRSEGYRIIHEEPYSRFGPELIKQVWELELV